MPKVSKEELEIARSIVPQDGSPRTENELLALNEDNEARDVPSSRADLIETSSDCISRDELKQLGFTHEVVEGLKNAADIEQKVRFLIIEDEPKLVFDAGCVFDGPVFKESLRSLLRNLSEKGQADLKNRLKNLACQVFKLNVSDYSDAALTLDNQDDSLLDDVSEVATAFFANPTEISPFGSNESVETVAKNSYSNAFLSGKKPSHEGVEHSKADSSSPKGVEEAVYGSFSQENDTTTADNEFIDPFEDEDQDDASE